VVVSIFGKASIIKLGSHMSSESVASSPDSALRSSMDIRGSPQNATASASKAATIGS